MLEEGAVTRIAELAREGQLIGNLFTKVGEHTLSTVQLHHMPVKEDPVPAQLTFGSLQALADYVRENRDGLALETCVLHVAHATAVRLLGPLTGEKRQRFTYAEARSGNLIQQWLGAYHAQDDFVVALQSRFTPEMDRAAVLGVVSKLKEEQSLETEDDGVTQRATARAGVHLAQQVAVPNPVRLAPFRTFREIDQPASSFVLRVQKGPRCALFEADGGAWELEAIARTAEWLRARVEGIPVLA
jgi:hypothetical protein